LLPGKQAYLAGRISVDRLGRDGLRIRELLRLEVLLLELSLVVNDVGDVLIRLHLRTKRKVVQGKPSRARVRRELSDVVGVRTRRGLRSFNFTNSVGVDRGAWIGHDI